MAPPSSQPSAKKQQSISSFFTRKPSHGVAPSSSPPASSAKPAAPTRKRPLQEDSDKGNNLASTRRKKRPKSFESESDEETNTLLPPTKKSQVTQKANPIVPVSSSDITNRYAYDASGSQPQEEDDEEERTKREKEKLHKKFVKKLGNPDSLALIKQRNFALDDETAALNGDGEGADEADDEPPPPPPKGKKKGGKASKLTPLEIQVLDIKKKHPDTLLIVEVGYKFRFFGEDARTAAKELSIMCIPGKFRFDEHYSEAHWDRFASASIPVHRLPVHAKRLVVAGYKVGVVRQVETAALKKAGDNRNAPFVRKLTNIYTKGTFVDDLGELGSSDDSATPSGGYLLCITESSLKGGMGTDEKVQVGILAVQPATGDIIYDSFQDGFMRSEIETRILHISPCEFLIVGDLTKTTEKLIGNLSGSKTNVFGDKCRVERAPRSKTMAAEASSHVTQFYADKVKDAKHDKKANALLDTVLKLSEPVTICLSSMITHLVEYGLEHVFELTKYFSSFSTRSHMLLNGTTLESLEVYRNQTDMSERGSLFWAIDKTLTKFGQRLLRKWVGRPLLDEPRLTERVTAVEELLENQSTYKVDQLETLLSSIRGDLERGLIRIYYGKCTRPELVHVLQTLQRISTVFDRVKSPEDSGYTSTLISECVATLPGIQATVVGFLKRINRDAAHKDDKYSFFREDEHSEATEEIMERKLGIAAVEQELDAHRKDAAKTLRLGKQAVTYVTVGGIEYLIEVPNSDLSSVPASWAKISGTKKVSRFHTPEVLHLVAERDQHKEALAAACDRAFKSLLAEVATHYQELRDAVSSLATLDCLLSLSKVAALPGYSKPTFLPTTGDGDLDSRIEIKGGRHPVAEQILEGPYIPFDMTLASPAPLAHVVTGPNMGGKSSFVRAVALLTLLAQVGSFVPAQSMTLTPRDAIFARMGARDNLFAGESTFMVEVGETATVLREATPRSLVLLDELGRGTSTHDGAAIASAVLEFVVDEGCLCLFVTHYQDIARVVEGRGGGVGNLSMGFRAEKSERVSGGGGGGKQGGIEEITFLYEVAKGMAHRSYGLNVARLARIPGKVLEVARGKSGELERDVERRRVDGCARLVGRVLEGGGRVDELVSWAEQL